MKLLNLAVVTAAALYFSACAGMVQQSSESTTYSVKYGYAEKQKGQLDMFGATSYEVVKPVTWSEKRPCSVVNFVAEVTADGSTLHDVINIRAEQTNKTKDGNTTYSCRYWGLGVRYKNITAEQAKEWVAIHAKPAVATTAASNASSSKTVDAKLEIPAKIETAEETSEF